MQQNSQPNRRNTPHKRRPARNATQSPAISAHKTYASENDVADMPSDVPFHTKIQATGGPRTPRKTSSPAPPSSLNPSSQSNPRSANKGRPKNVSTSPGPMKPGRRTPPQTALPRTAAFAGATFHASPAPSSLPIPSFLAKSMPDSPGPRDSPGPPVSQEPSPPPTDSEMPTPLPRSGPSKQPPREESPLDIFFRADRAEKEKARRASSANALMMMSGPFSPPSQPMSPFQDAQTSGSPRESPGPQSRRGQGLRNSMLGMSDTELNGTAGSGKSLGPAFSTPYHERIRAHRSAEKPAPDGGAKLSPPPSQLSPPAPIISHSAIQQPPFVDRSAALKEFLHGGQMAKASATTAQSTGLPPFYAPSTHPGPGAAVTMSQQARTMHTSGGMVGDSSDTDLRAMEANLRRMLRLDSNLGNANTP